jgi:hypothetical protein
MNSTGSGNDQMTGFCENCNEPSDFMKRGGFLDQLSSYQLQTQNAVSVDSVRRIKQASEGAYPQQFLISTED